MRPALFADRGGCTRFHLMLKPASGACNLRCDYCFNPRWTNNGPGSDRFMPLSVLEAAIAKYLATLQSTHVFVWQGGEPAILGVDFFRNAIELQRKHARHRAVIANAFQTNATLLDAEFATFLAEWKFLVGVSLDGPREIHDRYRTNVNGRGSHSAVIRGVRTLRHCGVEPTALAVVTNATCKRGPEVYRYLRDEGFSFIHFMECVDRDSFGMPLEWAVRPDGWGRFLCEVFDEWYPDRESISVRLFDSLLASLVYGSGDICTGQTDCRQYLLVEAGGDVFPCDFYARSSMRLGNVLEVEFDELRGTQTYRAFGVAKSQLSRDCVECPYLVLCRGDCPRTRLGDNGKSVLCDGWRQFFAHAADRLQALVPESNHVVANAPGIGRELDVD